MKIIDGQENLDSFQLKKWMQTIKDQPRSINYKLLPLYTLLSSDSSRRKALEEATHYIRLQAINATNAYINSLENIAWSLPIPHIKCFSS